MPIQFTNAMSYNEVFFYNSNKLAFLSTLFFDPCGAYSFSKFFGGCKIELLESPIIHCSINHLSKGFMNFVKQK